MLSEQQLRERSSYLGGSDAAGVLGLSRWSSPLSVWTDKTEVVPKEDISDKLCVRLGNKLEQAVAELFEEDTGKKLHRVNDTLRHPSHSFLGANLDRRVVGEKAGFEAKTASPFKTNEWKDDEIPVEYLIQCNHYLAVTGWDAWYIACILGNQKFVWKKIERNENLIQELVAKETHFWNTYVVPRVMPTQIMWNDSDTLQRLFPVSVPKSTIELGDEAAQHLELRDSLMSDYKSLESQIERETNILKAMLGDNEAGTFSSGAKITWTSQTRNSVDTAALKEQEPSIYQRFLKTTAMRVFRTSKPKGGK